MINNVLNTGMLLTHALRILLPFVQLLGAVVGAWLIQSCTPPYLQRGLGSHDLGRSIFDSQGCLMEIMLTFMLIFVIFGVAVDRRGPG